MKRFFIWGIAIAMILCLLFTSCDTTGKEWEEAVKNDSVESYKSFIERHPKSEFIEEAQRRLEEAQIEHAWEQIETSNDLENVALFIETYPHSTYTEKAKSLYTLLAMGRLSVLTPDQIADGLRLPHVRHPSRFIVGMESYKNEKYAHIRLYNSWYRLACLYGFSSSGVSLEPLATSDGAEHVWLSSFQSDDGWSIESDKEIPLTFKVDHNKGYVYLCGLGIFKTAEGKVFEFCSLYDFERLQENLRYPQLLVRQGSIQMLDWMKKTSAVPELILALEDVSWQVRRDAAHALGTMGDSLAISPLMKTILDNDAWVREVSAEAICRLLNLTGQSDPWIQLLDSSNPSIRSAAIQGIANAGGSKEVYLNALQKHRRVENDSAVKEAILQVIKELHREGRSGAEGDLSTGCGPGQQTARIGAAADNAYRDISLKEAAVRLFSLFRGKYA